MQPGYVFVSFASADAALAERAVTLLEHSGLRCWLSERDIEPAASYPAAITDAVKNSGALLLLLTSAANDSPHVMREVELAFSSRRPILPVRINGAKPTPDLQYFLSRSQWLDAGVSLDDDELARIDSRLRELLRGGPGPGGLLVDGRRWRRIAAIGAVPAAAVVALLVWNARRVPDQAEGPATNPLSGEEPAHTAVTAVTVKVNARDGESYVWVPPGRFIMGCSAGDPDCDKDEGPSHAVEIRRGFWLARTEVVEPRYRAQAAGRTAAVVAPADALPATRVSWAAAKAYCKAIAGRLPTEAEWEYAARAGTTTRYYDSLQATAWFSDNSDGAPHPVGMKTPNAFGLYDMLGNVSEWVLDRYYNAYDDTSDPTDVEQPLAGNASGVARGGSWLSEKDGVRVSRRLEMPPDAEEPHIGFRCAMDQIE